jgi:hypothetical protein
MRTETRDQASTSRGASAGTPLAVVPAGLDAGGIRHVHLSTFTFYLLPFTFYLLP